MKTKNNKTEQRLRRRIRIRARISGTQDVPRLSVFKSLKYVYAQLIDDENSKTLASASSLPEKGKKEKKSVNKTEMAKKVGVDIAKKANALGIKKVVFDRGGFIYTGRIEALAESARESGLQF